MTTGMAGMAAGIDCSNEPDRCRASEIATASICSLASPRVVSVVALESKVMNLPQLAGPGELRPFHHLRFHLRRDALQTLLITMGATLLVRKNRWLEKLRIHRCPAHAGQVRSELIATLKLLTAR